MNIMREGKLKRKERVEKNECTWEPVLNILKTIMNCTMKSKLTTTCVFFDIELIDILFKYRRIVVDVSNPDSYSGRRFVVTPCHLKLQSVLALLLTIQWSSNSDFPFRVNTEGIIRVPTEKTVLQEATRIGIFRRYSGNRFANSGVFCDRSGIRIFFKCWCWKSFDYFNSDCLFGCFLRRATILCNEDDAGIGFLLPVKRERFIKSM